MPSDNKEKIIELTPETWGDALSALQRYVGMSSNKIHEQVGTSVPTLLKMKSGKNRSVTLMITIFNTLGAKVFIELPADNTLTSIFQKLKRRKK